MSSENTEDEKQSTGHRPLRNLAKSFVAFLLPAIHTILYLRDIYPSTSFLACRAYDFPVHQSRHPGVCAWINDAVDALATELIRGVVRRVALVIVHPQTLQPLERYVWDVEDWVIKVKADVDDDVNGDVNTAAIEAKDHEWNEDDHDESGSDDDEHNDTANQSDSEDESGVRDADVPEAEEQLRALLSKLALCKDRLDPLPSRCTFTLTVELSDGGDQNPPQLASWVTSSSTRPSTDRTGIASEADNGADNDLKRRRNPQKKNQVHALPAVDAETMAFEMWIEESRAKFDLAANPK